MEAGANMRGRIAQLLDNEEATPDSEGEQNDDTGLEFDLRRSVEDIVAHFQPIRAPGTNQVLGYEALARWRHPALGQIPPVRFIPLAERTGLIQKIGRTMTRNALRALQTFRQNGGTALPFVSVNVSVHELNNVNYAPELYELVEKHGVTPSRIYFEITERAVLDRTAEAAQTIARLAEYGFPLYIDDFGAGYSSLSHLIDLPLAGIKIDPIFIPASEGEERRLRMLSTLTILARDLGLKVIAEGIETPYQEELSQSLGIDYVQGFGVGRPSTM